MEKGPALCGLPYILHAAARVTTPALVHMAQVSGQARPDGSMPEQVAMPSVPRFVAPLGMDVDLFDPATGYGLFGKPTYGTRFGSGPLPCIKAEDTRPVCIEFYNSGRCTRRGPHGQACMYRHVLKDDPNKVDQNAPTGTAAAKVADRVKPRIPADWVSKSSRRHPLVDTKAQREVRRKAENAAEEAVAAAKIEQVLNY
ncbi:hypothetical protein T492DRAFT_270078 [Pavlovales sp. CCMP2436]|nr:hypothetical protein T492DRAFT_270078 [Pavlovales sp. CCMP2436]